MSQLGTLQQGPWAVVDAESGQPIVTFTSFLSMEYKSQTKVPDQPTEEGGFFTYNKVATPEEVYVTLAMQGTDDVLSRAIVDIKAYEQAAKLVNVETPTVIVTSQTVAGMNFSRRTEDGLGLLIVELELREVRVVKAQYANIPVKQAKNPSDASKQDRGKVQNKSLAKQGLNAVMDG